MALDYPDQSYYPSWKLRLGFRFEEFGDGALKKAVPAVPAKNLKGVKQERAPLDAVKDPDVPGRFLLKARVTKATLDDAIKNAVFPDSSADGLTHVVAGVIPKKFEWRQNGFRTADELKATLRWADFPFDPRVIRSCAVEFYLGTLTPTEFAAGVGGAVRLGTAEPLNVVPNTYLDAAGNQRSNLRFTGWVDKMKMSLNEEEPYVEFECRDNTQLLLGQLAPPQLVIGMKDPIDMAVATYLSNFPQFAGLTVEYRGEPGGEVPKLEGALAGTAFRPQLGPQPAGGGGGADGADLVVWDYLTDVCGSIGHLIRVDGNAIIIQRPSTVLHGDVNPREDDPYRARKLASGEFRARAFVYGRNVSSFELARDYARKETQNVEVRSYLPRRKNVLVARFPGKDDRVPTATPGDAKADNKWTIVRVRGIEDKEVLQRIAEDYYHGRNRNEIEVVIKTKNLASFGGGNEDPDILDLKAGDSVEVLVDRGNPGSGAETEQKLSTQALCEQHLVDLGFQKALAAAYARAYTNAGFQRLYRLREMAVTGDVAEGVAFELRGANFVQVRGDVPPKGAPAKPNASSAPTQGGGYAGGGAPAGTVPVVTKDKVLVTDAGGKTIKSEGGITIFKKKPGGG